MPATHISGQEYKYLFDHERDKPTFHLSSDCAGNYTSDMTESAAVSAALDGEMVPCGNCCDTFPLEFHDGGITDIPLERGGWFSLGEKKATLKPEMTEVHRDVYRELVNRGMRMNGIESTGGLF